MVNRLGKIAGAVACLVAVLILNGAHWAALQSVAWGRMLADFSRQDSLRVAVAKTFSGRYPCPLCLKVRQGWHEEKQQREKLPWEKPENSPEPFWELRYAAVPPVPSSAFDEQPFVPQLAADFIETPPFPPPRARAWVL
jgi:hypothetical protein